MTDARDRDRPITVKSPDAFDVPLADAVNAMQVGIALVDANQRITMMNPAFLDSLGLPPGAFPPGIPMEDAVRASALRGVYGPGDPEEQTAAIMATDRTQSGRLRRISYQGRSFDLYTAPMSGGGSVVTTIETTALIAARAQAERTVTESAAALGTLRIGLAAFASNSRLLFANPRFSELLSLPIERVMPGAAFETLLGLMASREEYSDAEGTGFIASQRAVNRAIPHMVRRMCGNGLVIDVVSAPLPDGGWTITVTDVTPIVRAEDEARRRAQMLDTILAAVPHGICVYTADHRVMMFNPTYTQVMAGAPLSVGDRMADIVRRRAESGEFGLGEAGTIYDEQMGFDITLPQMRRRRRPNGTVIDIRTAPLPDGGHMSVVTDITPLAAAEAEVTRRAEEMAAMLASIRHGILLWGPDGRLIVTNAVTPELLGLPPDMLTPGTRLADILAVMRELQAWADTENVDELVRELTSRDHTHPYIRQITMRTGRVLDMRSDPTANGGWVTTYTDVTDARMAEEALRRSRDIAEAANQAKSRFLATMSHELRTPLHAVIGFSDALIREAPQPSPDRIAEFAHEINTAGRQLLSLINVILDMARIEAGRFDLADDTIELDRLVRAAVRAADIDAQAAEITVVVDIAEGLPLLRADERRLMQALSQLLSNAIKFTEVGGTVWVDVRLDKDGALLLTVRDTGIGIPRNELDRVFEPFTQLDNALSRRFPGSGLGLYIARALVTGHGGLLTLRSDEGRGTTAEIRLPAERLLR